MNKKVIISILKERHQEFIEYVDSLTEDQFLFSYQEKWTAGQQIAHINLCLAALAKVFGIEKTQLEQRFGLSNRKSASIATLLFDFKEKLKAGAKAPSLYEPKHILFSEKKAQIETLVNAIYELCSGIENFSEDELDKYQLPHPLLGNVTLREMLFNTIHHVAHHEETNRLHLAELKVK
jgi:hypothetical protein